MGGMLNFGRVYELGMAKTYVRHWGMAEGVREIIQNAIDSESPFEYEIGADSLIVHSRFATLPTSSLLLGATTKADNEDTIGSFGEGYKLACLALLRAGYGVTIHNGSVIWRPVFRQNKQYGAEVLCIEESSAPKNSTGLAFEISGLSPSDIETIRAQCLYMQDNIGAVIETSRGLILRERPGKLYVGSLFVCDTELKFGYSIKPQYLRLERDRQTVSTFDLQFITKDMWFEADRPEEVAQLMDDSCPDLKYAEYGCPELVKEACYRAFMEKNPGKVIASSQQEMNALVKQGMSVYVHTSSAYVSAVKSSDSYQQTVRVRVQTPMEILEEWFATNRKHMRRDGLIAFRELINKSADWRRG